MNNNNTRIFDRSQYNKKTIDTFEILGAYFVDLYYNYFYIEAKKLRTNKSVVSITEGYKHALNAFIQGIENPKSYKKILMGIHSFYVSSGYNNIIFSDCVEKITNEFIPQDYHTSVIKNQKLSILKLVISQANKNFIEKLVKNYLSLVIDNHSETDNIRVLQDVFIDILMLERESIYHRFISTKTKGKTAPNNTLIEAMQNEIKKLCGEKFELKKLTTSLKKIIINKETDLVNLRDDAAGYLSTIEDLQLQVRKSKPVINYMPEITPYTPYKEILNTDTSAVNTMLDISADNSNNEYSESDVDVNEQLNEINTNPTKSLLTMYSEEFNEKYSS